MTNGSKGVSSVVGAGRYELGGCEEECVRDSDGIRVDVGLGIKHGLGRIGGVEGSERSGVGRKSNPLEGRRAGITAGETK